MVLMVFDFVEKIKTAYYKFKKISLKIVTLQFRILLVFFYFILISPLAIIFEFHRVFGGPREKFGWLIKIPAKLTIDQLKKQ